MDKKTLEQAIKEKLEKDGVDKEWMKTHLLRDKGDNDE